MGPTRPAAIRRENGFTMTELMVAMAIGSILAAALLILFSNVMQANREQFNAARQIENGRYAMDLLVGELRLAGYYGDFAALPRPPAALPDPCAIPAEGSISQTTTDSPFGLHIQGYSAPDLATRPGVPSACASLLDAATLRPGSDLVVVRRLDTRPLLDSTPTIAFGDRYLREAVYAQTEPGTMDIQYATASPLDRASNTRGEDTSLCRKDFSRAVDATHVPTAACPFDPASARPRVAAHIRRVHVHVYFIANCRRGSGADGQCTAADDGIPTLKRLELTAESGARKMKIVPLAEGIEFLKVRYGLDTASHIAGQSLDGSVDALVPASAVALADWQNVVMLDLRLLARNSEATPNHSDAKTYDLGGMTYAPAGANAPFKRHAYASQVYIVNIGGRRES